MPTEGTLNSTSMQRLVGVHPNLVRVILTAAKDCPVRYEVVEGLRSLTRQRELYNKGRLTPGPIVTKTMDSKHLKQWDGFGHAVDICPFKDGKFLWNDQKGFEAMFHHINKVAKNLKINLITGSDWDDNLVMDHLEREAYIKKHGRAPLVDWPHWELA
jgi:peptidoglycan L-alanyl-D-glutamate endopeptidase CwlK